MSADEREGRKTLLTARATAIWPPFALTVVSRIANQHSPLHAAWPRQCHPSPIKLPQKSCAAGAMTAFFGVICLRLAAPGKGTAARPRPGKTGFEHHMQGQVKRHLLEGEVRKGTGH